MRSPLVSLAKGIQAHVPRSILTVPEFLCPALCLHPQSQYWTPRYGPLVRPRLRPQLCRSSTINRGSRYVHTIPGESSPQVDKSLKRLPTTLPISCSGCGALAQSIEPAEAGFYSLTRRLRKAEKALQQFLPVSSSSEPTEEGLECETPQPPICDRCHTLLHHSSHTTPSIAHPSLDSIQNTILSSPHAVNHIYHVLDAADFPLSLLPSLPALLSSPLRSQNRRSLPNDHRFASSRRIPTLSFIITRSDLLAPQAHQVDALMPYLVHTLRDALGRSAASVRLGNVHCVSSKREWWTQSIKEDIWKRGGAAWLVGKVNVGKSRLLHSVFPKGRSSPARITSSTLSLDSSPIDEHSLLPPPQTERPYPDLPVVSNLPGTTASPIRIPYGNKKGEVIDLPGLSRSSSLEAAVRPDSRAELVMTTRPRVTQRVLKPGQSLLLDGLIRITPVTPSDDLIVMCYNFTPLGEHVTSTEKAVSIQAQLPGVGKGVSNILAEGMGTRVRSAGKVQLAWDVTRWRAGPVVRKEAGGMRVENLAWRVVGVDVLIEGVGWVEVVAQIRRRRGERAEGSGGVNSGEKTHPGMPQRIEGEDAQDLPEVEIFTPEGDCIGSRPPMNAWMIGEYAEREKVGGKGNRSKARPRMSMKGSKKEGKVRARAKAVAQKG